ncbi:YhcH/YjgK/YiaL family protein [Paenibacillus allorhizosphaerae]|uniref:DUF386 domain-containing protein n=1 Tax=Paenibacillus allorhizosphaerae TaxID=2849866 RepID=A0ABN7TH01_9BACL|nr:YhcH/YjgK/YiaL family protein [Paenibacillus allorhizosphaerae]CAG7626922.1 hypothetical protein PAECIP111802_01300 [Paenibacillus allorhizosphaerae]
MIFDTVSSLNRNKSQYGHAVQSALQFISSLNVEQMPDTVEIDGKRMYVMKQTVNTVKPSERLAEVHLQYADIHLVVEGEELQGCAPSSGGSVPEQDQLELKDYALFAQVEDEQFIRLKPGSFTIYWPGEVHRPNCSEDGERRVVKLVVKIHRDLFI